MCNAGQMDDFASRLRKSRLNAELTQRQLAKRAGIGVTTLQAYERGIVGPSAHALCCLADALGVSMDYLYGRGK